MGLGLGAAAVQTCGLRNFKSAVALSPGVSSVLSHSLPTSDPVTCSTHCLMASWKQKRHPWEKETKHPSSQSIWNPLSSRLGNFRGSLGCSVPRDKAAAALTSLSMTCILLGCAKSKNSGSFPARLTTDWFLSYLHLSVNLLVILAPAVCGGRKGSRRCAWNPASWQEEKGRDRRWD